MLLVELNRIKSADENDEIEVAAVDNHVFFRSQGRVLYSRTLEGSFPNFDKVIPVGNDVIARLDREAFTGVLSRVAILTNDASKMVTVSLAEGRLTISTSNPNAGEANESLPVELAEGVSGDVSVKIGLNYEYLLQFLQVVGGETLELQLKDSSTQGLLLPTEQGPFDYRYVVMPMRLS